MQWTRRTFLGSIAAGSVSLAGCSLGPVSGGAADSGAGGGAGFEAVRVAGRTLVVSLGSVSAETVNVIAPDGSAYASRQVVEGATTVEFDIGMSYTPGEYRVVATSDGSVINESTITIVPDLAITEVGIGANHVERMPRAMGTRKPYEGFVTVANRGSGPAVVEKLLFLGKIPNPTTELKKVNNEKVSGIFDRESGVGDVAQYLIRPGDKVTLFSNTLPFSFEGEGIDCKNRMQRGKLRVVVSARVESASATAEYTAQYSEASEYYKCKITLSQ